MEITSIDLYPTRSSDRVLTYASIVFDEEFVVHNIRLIRTPEKLIVAMPNEEYDGGFRDVAHPITRGCRQKIREALLEKYEREVGPPDGRTSEGDPSESSSGVVEERVESEPPEEAREN